jgi:hypothetical protein
MYRLLTVVLTGVLIAGCVTSKEVFLADGSKSYRISCEGMGLRTENCLETAGAICGPSGFTIVDQRGEAVPIDTASGSLATRSFFVKCNAP